MKIKEKHNNMKKMKILPLIIITLVIFSGIFIAMSVKADDDCEAGRGECGTPPCSSTELYWNWEPDTHPMYNLVKCPAGQVCCVGKTDTAKINSVCRPRHPEWSCLKVSECESASGADHMKTWERHLCPGPPPKPPGAEGIVCCLAKTEEKEEIEEEKPEEDKEGGKEGELSVMIIGKPGKGPSPLTVNFWLVIKGGTPSYNCILYTKKGGEQIAPYSIPVSTKYSVGEYTFESDATEIYEVYAECTDAKGLKGSGTVPVTIEVDEKVPPLAEPCKEIEKEIENAKTDEKFNSLNSALDIIIANLKKKLETADEAGKNQINEAITFCINVKIKKIEKHCEVIRGGIEKTIRETDEGKRLGKFKELNAKLDKQLKELILLKKEGGTTGTPGALSSCEIEKDGKDQIEIAIREGRIGDISKILGLAELAKEVSKWEKHLGKAKKAFKEFFGIKKGLGFAQRAYLVTTWIYSTAEAVSYTRGSGTCSAEQPLPGIDYCESCNMPFTECTPVRCKILGKCLWIDKTDATGGYCMPGVCTPTAMPIIENMDVRFFIDRTKSWRNFTEINPPCPPAPPNISQSATCISIDRKVPSTVSDIEINISLNQHAKCRYIIDKFNASFDEMTGEFEDNEYYPLHQEARIDVTGLELGENHSIYIKCEGTCGQSHDPGFDWNFIKFEFEEKPDELPPIIVKLVPDPLTQYISSESIEETIEVWLDEAGYCQYSHISEAGKCSNLTTEWDSMCGANEVEHNVKAFNCNRNTEQCCSPGIPEPTCYNKYECGRCYLTIDTTTGYDEFNWTQLAEGAEMPELADKIPKETIDYMKNLGMTGIGKVFTYMFRCSDYPAGNKMREENSYMYVIMTYPPFEMNLTAPENNSDSYDREWDIGVETSRATECRYLASNKSFAWPAWEDMESVDGGFRTEHEGITEELVPSDYHLYVRCRDTGGLEEKNFVEFTVLEDLDWPIAIRLYGWKDYLYIETNEPSNCVYSIVDCDYDFDDGSEMVGNMQYMHSAPWTLDHNYYIKCKDKWDNEPPAAKCTVIISPYEIPEL